MLVALLAAACLCVVLASGDNASAALEFSEQLDGKCQILSDGGKLVVLYNRHPSRAVRYRLIRHFAEVRQRGRAMGTVLPGEAPHKIGCNRVDGRVQYWTIERAQFADEES